MTLRAGGGPGPSPEPGNRHGAPGRGEGQAGGAAGPRPVHAPRHGGQRPGLEQRLSDEHRGLRRPSIFQAQATQFLFNRPQSYAVAQAKEQRARVGHRHGRQARRNRLPHHFAVARCRARRPPCRDGAQAAREPGEGDADGGDADRRGAGAAGRGQARGAEPGRGAADAARTGSRPGRRRRPRSRWCWASGPRTACGRPRNRSAPRRRCRSPRRRPSRTRWPTATGIARAGVAGGRRRGWRSGAPRPQRLPRVDLVAQYALLRRSSTTTRTTSARSSAITGRSACRFQLPLLPGPGVDAAVAQSEAEMRRLRLELNQLRNRITAETRQNFRDVRKAETARGDGAAGPGTGARTALHAAGADAGGPRPAAPGGRGARGGDATSGSPFTTRSSGWSAPVGLLRQTGDLVAALR